MLIPHRLLLYLYLIPPSQCYSKRGNECEDDLLYTDSASSIHTRCIICLSVKCLDVLFSVSLRCLIVAMFRLSRGSRHEACHRSHEPSPLQSGLNIRSRSRQVAATTCFSQGGSRGTERPAAQRWVNILKHPSFSRRRPQLKLVFMWSLRLIEGKQGCGWTNTRLRLGQDQGDVSKRLRMCSPAPLLPPSPLSDSGQQLNSPNLGISRIRDLDLLCNFRCERRLQFPVSKHCGSSQERRGGLWWWRGCGGRGPGDQRGRPRRDQLRVPWELTNHL